MVDKLYSHSILVTDGSARWLTPKAEELYERVGAIHRTVGSKRFLRVLASRDRLTIDHELLFTPHSPLEVSLSLTHRLEMTGKNLRAHRCKERQRLCVLRGQQSLHTETAERSVKQDRNFLFFWQAFQAASRAISVWRNLRAVLITS